MPGSEPYFLGYNKDSIFKWIIGIEGHLQKAKKLGTSPSDLACVIKHGADIEGHADEAVSHSLITEGESTSGKFADLGKQIHTFWKGVQKGETTPEQGIKQIRQIRGYFESFNPEYDISKCRSCGPVPEETLTFAKRLKGKTAYSISGETSTMAKVIALPASKLNLKSALTIYGVQWLGKIVAKTGEYLDTTYPTGVAGYAPSLIWNAAWTIGGLVVATHKKFKGSTQYVAAALGGFVSTEYMDTVLNTVMPPAARLRYVAVTPRGSPTMAAVVPAGVAQGALGKYT